MLRSIFVGLVLGTVVLALDAPCLAGASTGTMTARGHRAVHATSITNTVYVVHYLSAPRGVLSSVAHGINENGIVVGTSQSSSTTTAELWHVGTAGREIRRQDLKPPHGYAGAALLAVDDSGVPVGAVFAASDGSGVSYSSPAYFESGKWNLLRGSGNTPVLGEAYAIAANGTIGATLWGSHGQASRAVAFSPLAGSGYSRSRVLPLSPHATGSQATSAYSFNGKTVVGGSEVVSSASGSGTKAAIWVNGAGPFLLGVPTPVETETNPFNSVAGLYRVAPNRLLVVVSSSYLDGGVLGSQSFVIPVDTSKARPVVARPSQLSIPAEDAYALADAIGGTPSRSANAATIGGDVADGAALGTGAVWQVALDHGVASVDAPTVVSYQPSQPDQACPVYQVLAIGGNGAGAGFAFCGGEAEAATIYPSLEARQ